MQTFKLVFPDFDKGYPLPPSAFYPPHYRRACEVVGSAIVTGFGGYTSHEGRGAWRDHAGKVHEGPVRVFSIASDSPDPEFAACLLRALAKHYGAQYSQACVYVEIDGAAEFIAP